MRIAIFSDNFFPELSGISDSVITLSKELAKRGHFINFYVPKYGPKNFAAANVPYEEIELGENIHVIRLGSFPYRTGTGQGRFVIPTGLGASRAAEFRPDIIHTQLFFGVGLEALIAGRRLHKPVIGTNHTALKEFLKYSPIRAAWFDRMLLNYVNWYYEKCTFVTAPSQSVFDEMVSLGFKNSNRSVISNPINIGTFRPLADRETLAKKFGLNEATIFHAGRLADERNPDVLIRALPIVKKEIPNALLAFAGKGSAEAKLKSLAKDLGVEDSVKFLGFVSKTDLVELYNAARVFAIASTADTQSLVMMQAMACSIPVVGVRARALPEYINTENGFIVEPNDPQAMAQKLIYLLKNKDIAERLGKGGRKYVEQFSEPAIAERWEQIYEEVIKSSHEA